MGCKVIMDQSFDYIIIGAGTSGCVIAHRLSENPNVRVLLLEGGGPDDKPEIHDPAALYKLWGSEVDYLYTSEKEPGLNDRQMVCNRGKVLGGSSAIHAMIHIRGNPRDFDHWNYLGNEGWSYAEVLPYFNKSEDYIGGASHYHGAGGPLSIIDLPDPTPVARAFVAAALELGFKGGPHWDFNGAEHEGTGFYQFTITRDGHRASSAVAFLNPAKSRPNLTIVTSAQAVRLLFQEQRAVGVAYRQDGEIKQAQASREVIVSAGAYDSPKLLLLSGIGPAAYLQEQGIAVVADLPGVGQNLSDHLRMPVIFKNTTVQPIPIVLAEAGLLVHTRPQTAAAAPDLQINFNAAVPALVPPSYPGDPRLTFNFITILAQPQSRGTVTLRSTDPTAPPVIRHNYLESETDVDVLVHSIHLARRMVRTQALRPFYAGEVMPGEQVQDEADLRQFVRDNVFTIWHPVGTCKMGRDRLAVVDPQLRVRGVQGLRVADASIMPSIPSSNPNAACYMIGEKAADLIRGAA
jgi:choline dehydrogenase